VQATEFQGVVEGPWQVLGLEHDVQLHALAAVQEDEIVVPKEISSHRAQ
jgi:hypothetical protein